MRRFNGIKEGSLLLLRSKDVLNDSESIFVAICISKASALAGELIGVGVLFFAPITAALPQADRSLPLAVAVSLNHRNTPLRGEI